MRNLLQNFSATEAAEAAGDGGIFGALGIDWRLLLLQVLAFAALLWILGKFVYPPLIKAIDSREQKIAESLKAATEAESKAEAAQEQVAKLLRDARSNADEILNRSKQEAAAQLAEAETKASARAEQIVQDAHAQLQTDVAKARAALKKDAANLVATATEKVLREKVDSSKDAALITRSIADATGERT